MLSIQLPFEKKPESTSKDVKQDTFKPGSRAITAKSSWSIPTTTYTSQAVLVPHFREHVTLKKSILSDNESKLLVTPFVPESLEIEMMKQLPKSYSISHDNNVNMDLRSEQCRFYKDAIDVFLEELGISWSDILFWLLASEQSISRLNGNSPSNKNYRRVLCDRSAFENEKFTRNRVVHKLEMFDRTDQKWQELLHGLQKPTADRLRLSSLACMSILKACGFNVWYLVKQCDIVRSHVSRKIKSSTDTSELTYRVAMCRVCHELVCVPSS
jgi:hypothetical protein